MAVVIIHCFPDEPRYWVRYKDREILARHSGDLAACLPLSATDVTVHYDRIRGSRVGTFRFRAGDASSAAGNTIDAEQARRLGANEPQPEWWPAFETDGKSAPFTFRECTSAHFLMVFHEATGEGYFRSF